MANLVKYTVTLGKPNPKDVIEAAGADLTGTDVIQVQMDITKMRKEDALRMLDQVRDRIFARKWPAL